MEMLATQVVCAGRRQMQGMAGGGIAGTARVHSGNEPEDVLHNFGRQVLRPELCILAHVALHARQAHRGGAQALDCQWG